MKNTKFPDGGSLSELQLYIKNKCIERGFDSAEDLEIFLLFTEEIGELAKAVRKKRALFDEIKHNSEAQTEESKKQKIQTALEEEMADVLSYLLDLANRFNVDLEKAFKEKEAVNDSRSWKS